MIGNPGEMKCRLPVGAEVQAGGGVLFRVWAPKPARVTLLVGELADLAPTCLDLLGIPKPQAMSGVSLLNAS